MHSESNIRVWGLVSHPDPRMKALEGSECETICYMYLDRIGQLSSIGLALTLMHTSSTETLRKVLRSHINNDWASTSSLSPATKNPEHKNLATFMTGYL